MVRKTSRARVPPQRLLLSLPWLVVMACSVLMLCPTAAAASSAASSPRVPRATHTASSAAAPTRTGVLEGTAADDDGGSSIPRLCRNSGHDNVLRRVLRRQCPRPIDGPITTKGAGATLAAQDPASWAPWAYAPECVPSSSDNATAPPFCVFTYTGGSISIIATPEVAAGLAPALDRAEAATGAAIVGDTFESYSLASLPHSKDTGRGAGQAGDGDARLVIQAVPGKNLGVIARQPILRGTVLMRDRARVLADVRFPQHVRRADGRTLLHAAAARLWAPEVVRGLSRSVEARAGEAHGVLEENVLSTNSFSNAVAGVNYMALFPQIARINHACNPTATTRFDERDLTKQVIAFRDIKQGEEITISYTNFGLTRDERQHALRRRWGFTCTCDLCSAGADATAASDARRRRVVSLRGELVAHLEKGAFAAAIFAYEHELLDLVRAEHLAEHLGEHFEVLARLHLATGNRTAAGTYAQQALDEMAAFGRAAIDDDEDSEAATSVRELRAIVKALGGKAAPRSTEEEGTTGA